jgi:hypothetical protein
MPFHLLPLLVGKIFASGGGKAAAHHGARHAHRLVHKVAKEAVEQGVQRAATRRDKKAKKDKG